MSTVIGYAPGAFDLFHVGRLNLLRQARGLCDHLVVGVVADEICELTKGVRPVVPLAERMEIVGSLGIVDDVHAELTTDRLDAWRAVGFHRLLKGDDWRGTPKGRALEERLATVGAELHYVAYTRHTSSTQLRRALAARSSGVPVEPATGTVTGLKAPA